ncbi:MAG: amidohydrolase family protein, partial [Oscillospiraceae bacterium]
IIALEIASENVKICLVPIIGGRTKPELYNHSVKSSGILHLNGLKVAINTDHPEVPIDMLALSAAICYHNGLPYNEALNSITCNASKLLKLDDKIGSLKSGKDGDILIFDGDPISGFNTPKTVIIDGKIIKE